jgi:hypothetical protein
LPRRSDVNLLLILDQVDAARLRALGPAFSEWEAAGQPPPIILSKVDWERSADAFPLEIADMALAYRVLRGDNPLASIAVDRADLRRALERELRGKMLRLRQAYATFTGKGDRLAELAQGSAGVIQFLFRMLVSVAGKLPRRRPAGSGFGGSACRLRSRRHPGQSSPIGATPIGAVATRIS